MIDDVHLRRDKKRNVPLQSASHLNGPKLQHFFGKQPFVTSSVSWVHITRYKFNIHKMIQLRLDSKKVFVESVLVV
jgi:hypothetical protein